MTEELGSEVNLIFTVDAHAGRDPRSRPRPTTTRGTRAFEPLAPTDATVCMACVDARTVARPGSAARLMIDAGAAATTSTASRVSPSEPLPRLA